MEHSPRRRRRSREQWVSIITRAEASLMATAAFCAAEGISTTRFSLWRKRFQASAPDSQQAVPTSAGFLDFGLLTAEGDPRRSWEVELDLGGGLRLRLRRG
jgi:putative transposase